MRYLFLIFFLPFFSCENDIEPNGFTGEFWQGKPVFEDIIITKFSTENSFDNIQHYGNTGLDIETVLGYKEILYFKPDNGEEKYVGTFVSSAQYALFASDLINISEESDYQVFIDFQRGLKDYFSYNIVSSPNELPKGVFIVHHIRRYTKK